MNEKMAQDGPDDRVLKPSVEAAPVVRLKDFTGGEAATRVTPFSMTCVMGGGLEHWSTIAMVKDELQCTSCDAGMLDMISEAPLLP